MKNGHRTVFSNLEIDFILFTTCPHNISFAKLPIYKYQLNGGEIGTWYSKIKHLAKLVL